jgi:hypothetical protein
LQAFQLFLLNPEPPSQVVAVHTHTLTHTHTHTHIHTHTHTHTYTHTKHTHTQTHTHTTQHNTHIHTHTMPIYWHGWHGWPEPYSYTPCMTKCTEMALLILPCMHRKCVHVLALTNPTRVQFRNGKNVREFWV